jgi:hypothetical protein
MKRRDFQELATIGFNEAKVLLQGHRWEGAYYLGGYAAECAIKACIAKLAERHDFPDKERTEGSYTHKLMTLIKTAGLDAELRRAELEPEFAENWRIVRNWSEQSRYQRRTQSEAVALVNALRDRRYGVLRWLKHHW